MGTDSTYALGVLVHNLGMDRIDALKLFVRVVETGSFSRAARDLKVTQPTVTRQIAALEEGIRQRLFNRNTRRLSLTDAGRIYYERSQLLLDTFEETESLLRGPAAQLRGRLRVATSVAFGRRVLTPLMLAFMRAHPQVQVDLSCEDAYVDIVAQGIDVSVRLGKLRDSALAARHLGHNPWVTVASASYLRKHGKPERPGDLARHNVLVYSTVFSDDTITYNHPKQGRVPVRVGGSLRSNNLSALLAAVRADFGIAALPIYVAAASLKQGKVQPVLSDYTLPAQEIHAVFPSRRLISARVTALVEHLAQAFARSDWYAVAG